YGMFHFDGSQWTEIDQAQNAGLGAVWAAGAAHAWAVSDIGWIVHVTPTTFEGVPSGTTLPLNAVWGTSATDIWVGGQDGTLLHYEPVTGGGQPDAGGACKERFDTCGPGECCFPYNCRRLLDVATC